MALSLTLISGTDTTATLYGKDVVDSAHRVEFLANLGASYTTNGEALTAAAITALINGTCTTIKNVQMSTPSDGVFWPAWDPTNSKVLAFTATGTQVTSTTDLSAAAKNFYMVVTFS